MPKLFSTEEKESFRIAIEQVDDVILLTLVNSKGEHWYNIMEISAKGLSLYKSMPRNDRSIPFKLNRSGEIEIIQS